MNNYAITLDKNEIFSKIDIYFADFIERQGAQKNTVLAAALLSRAVQQGNICFSPEKISAKDQKMMEKEGIMLPEASTWLKELQEDITVIGEGGSQKPIIIENGSLSFQRYFEYEEIIAKKIGQLSKKSFSKGKLNIEAIGLIKNLLTNSSFIEQSEKETPQKLALGCATQKQLTVISGGPGTGKTTILAKILTILYTLKPTMKLALAAPTGKAAARMSDAIKNIKQELLSTIPEIEDTLLKIPDEGGSTIHRLLGTVRNSKRFKHNINNRLPYDLVIVDECSMISTPLMAKLLEALKDDAQLILLGDENQLDSVEAGRCFGGICRALSNEIVTSSSPHFPTLPLPKSSKTIVTLTKSYRFPDSSVIGKVSRSINTGESEKTLDLIKENENSNDTETPHSITWHESDNQSNLLQALLPTVTPYYKAIINAKTPEDALRAMDDIRILTCIKRGDFGSININKKVEESLIRDELIEKDEIFYENRPIIILQNDYSLNLFNGDIGIVRTDEQNNRRVYFPGKTEGTTRTFLPSRLPEHQTVYAMTIHKSQGSEFNHVVIVLPPIKNPVLTRELLYTAITRTKKVIDLYATEKIFKKTINRKTERNSALQDKISETLYKTIL